MELSFEQNLAFQKYLSGENVFITGPAGSGKSELIKKINHHAIQHFKSIDICALTGCAAVLLNCKARTLHSWAGIGLGKNTIDKLVKKINRNKFSKASWKSVHILVVDEVSMLSLKLFDLLDDLAKIIRKNDKPFGGIQLIFSGDFYQLPPVGDIDDIDSTRFCFESKKWDTIFPKSCQIELIKIFRQKDPEYSSILNQIRKGTIKKKTNELLLSIVGKKNDNSFLTSPTQLYPVRKKVDSLNGEKMSKLDGNIYKFKVELNDNLEMTKSELKQRILFNKTDVQYELEYLANNVLCEKEIILKEGAQVMSIINIQSEKGFSVCNGSQGIVSGFCESTGFPKVKFNNGIEIVMSKHNWVSEKIPGVGISQIPLILAWAITIHKSQGATLDCAEIDVGKDVFECGQTYVALSRVKSLQGLYLKSFDINKIKINKKVSDYYKSLT
jgi:ATP-dependent DNA helicase PIF1